MSIRVIGPLAQDAIVAELSREQTLNATLAANMTDLYTKSTINHDSIRTIEVVSESKGLNDELEFKLVVSTAISNHNLRFLQLGDQIVQIFKRLNTADLTFQYQINDLVLSLTQKIESNINTIQFNYDTRIALLEFETLSLFSQLEHSMDASISDLYAKYIRLKSRVAKLEAELHSLL